MRMYWTFLLSSFSITRWKRFAVVMVPSVAAAVLAVDKGAAIVRVHDVRETVAALAVWQAMNRERRREETRQ